MITHEDLSMINQKLNYMMTDEYIAGNNAPVKAEIMQEVKKTVEMIVQLDLQLQMGYVTKDEMSDKIIEIEEKLHERVTALDFNDAL